MRIVVTGSIGTGKSTVCQALLEHMPGYELVSADQMVHDLYANNTQFLEGLQSKFGTTDRKAIARIVFADRPKRVELEALSWAFLAQAVDALFLKENVIFEFPLFFEHPHWLGCPDVVIVLGCDEQTQRARVYARDGISVEAVDRILAAQLPQAEKAKRADIYLDTSGSRESVLAAVAALPAKLLHISNSHTR